MYRLVEVHFKFPVVDPTSGRKVTILRESENLRMSRGRDGIFVIEYMKPSMDGTHMMVDKTWYVEATNVACSRPASTELPAQRQPIPEDEEPPPTLPSGKLPAAKPAKGKRGKAA